MLGTKKKIITTIIFILFFFAMFMTFIPTTANAASCSYCSSDHETSEHPCSFCGVLGHEMKNHKCEICGKTHDLEKISSFQRTVYEMNNIVYAAQLFDKANGNSTAITTLEALEFDTSSGAFSILWNQAGQYYKVLEIFGLMLAVIYSLVETLAHLQHDNLTGEHFAREIMKMAIAAIFIMNGFEFATGIVEVGRGIINSVGTATLNSTANPANCMYSTFEASNPIEAIMNAFAVIGRIITLLLPWIILSVAKIIIAIACWARVLELVVRVIFSPIGMSDMFVYGTRSNGIKYMKKMLVCAIQGAVMMAMVQAYGVIVANVSPGQGQWVVTVIMSIVMLSSATKAKDIASDVCGV